MASPSRPRGSSSFPGGRVRRSRPRTPRSRPRATSSSSRFLDAVADPDAALPLVGEAGLLESLRFELATAFLVALRLAGVHGSGSRHQVAGAVLEPAQS